jgi:hypothetical protein
MSTQGVQRHVARRSRDDWTMQAQTSRVSCQII